MCNVACIIGWSTTIFLLITIPFYCLFLCMLIYNRKTDEFNHAFFKLQISLSIADIIALIVVTFWNQFLVFHGWVAEFCLNVLGNFGAHVLTLVLWGTTGVQNLTVISIALNRYSAYVHPMQFKLVSGTSEFC
jgi:hypothetical protein